MEVFDTVQDTAEGAESLPEETAGEPVGEDMGAQQAAAVPDRHGELDEFLDRYPHVTPDTIPKQVWLRFMQGESLSLAYAMHENALLQSKLEQLSRQEDNRRRTPGSLGNQGREPDEFDKYWDEP